VKGHALWDFCKSSAAGEKACLSTKGKVSELSARGMESVNPVYTTGADRCVYQVQSSGNSSYSKVNPGNTTTKGQASTALR
jgi:hypothetical protein